MKIQILPADLPQASIVQSIFEESKLYFRNTEKSEVKPDTAVREMTDSPPKERQTSSYEKVFCLINIDGRPIGVVDLHKDHPELGSCYVGLFLLPDSEQKKGLGRILFSYVEHFVFEKLKCKTLKLGVSEENGVEGFWLKVGFARNGRTYTWQGGGYTNQVFEMEKILDRN